jgi:antitoxin ParD1/3/4
MTIQLSGEREQFVRSLVQGGQFNSEDEVIDAALRLLQERDDQARLADLRREIAIGIEQADRGELGPFDPHATLARIRSRQAASMKNLPGLTF